MLRAENLTKVYDNGTKALDSLTLEVGNGQVYCLLGANGAGKSTTINLFLNYVQPTSGAAFVDDINVATEPLRARERIAYVPETVMLYTALNARQNLTFFAELSGKSGQWSSELEQLLEQVGLPKRVATQRVGSFSKGMRQRLAVAIALVKGCNNLLLDEPTSGLDPKAANEFMELVVSLRDQGKAILMSSHDIFRAREIADVVGIMRDGRLCESIPADRLQSEDLHAVYMQTMA
jgi:ABC-2 type transport system ATP-binding protein